MSLILLKYEAVEDFG